MIPTIPEQIRAYMRDSRKARELEIEEQRKKFKKPKKNKGKK